MSSLALSQDVSPGTGIEVVGGFNVQASVDPDTEKVKFEIYMKDNSWMGLVLGNAGMAPGADMIQIMANGVNSRVYDKFSQGYISPPVDESTNLDATFRFFEGGFIRFTIERDLDTGDSTHDYLIPTDQEFDLGWAVNHKTNEMLSKHTDAGAIITVLSSDGSLAFENEGPLNQPESAIWISSASSLLAVSAGLLAMVGF